MCNPLLVSGSGAARASRIATGLATIALLIPALASAQTPRFIVDVEGGPVWQSYNNAEIPNDGTATRFSIRDLLGTGPWPAGRLTATWNPGERHGVRLLLAPLSVKGTGTPANELRFAGAVFRAGQPVEATYTFNSYRLSYRYRVLSGQPMDAWIGVTAKIRDATIALEQGGTTSRKDDLGFVPLLHLAAHRRLAPGWFALFEADALAGGPGRAVDAALKLGYDVGDRWSILAGYRTIEGGADVEAVYSFAWLHYAVVSVTWRP
jgi:hypothetical protein